MRHQKEGRKLGRTASHRKALLRNMVSSLLEFEKIETTDAKAKELRKVADKMITWGKRGDLHARRLSLRVISSTKIVQKLFNDIAPRFKERKGGYTRIIKVGRRKGDNAPCQLLSSLHRMKKNLPRAEQKNQKKSRQNKRHRQRLIPSKLLPPEGGSFRARGFKGSSECIVPFLPRGPLLPTMSN